jgi:predicted nucleic-acid-binding Zn-ribbon protein
MMKKPPNYGQLSGPEQGVLDEWLKKKDCHCPACGAKEWGEANKGYTHFMSSTVKHPQDHPAILLPCKRCGYLAFFSPLTIGVETEA